MHYYLDWLPDDTQSCARKVKDPFSLSSIICLKFLVESRKILLSDRIVSTSQIVRVSFEVEKD